MTGTWQVPMFTIVKVLQTDRPTQRISEKWYTLGNVAIMKIEIFPALFNQYLALWILNNAINCLTANWANLLRRYSPINSQIDRKPSLTASEIASLGNE